MSEKQLIKEIRKAIKAEEEIHLAVNGRPDCKNCSLQETIEDILTKYENS